MSPLTFYDIGAGNSISKIPYLLGKHCNLVCFDPQESELKLYESHSSNNKKIVVPKAVTTSCNNSCNLYITSRPSCSSTLKPNESEFAKYGSAQTGRCLRGNVIREESVQSSTLLDVINTTGLLPDILKLDTQGSELSILESIESVIKKIPIIEVECEFVSLYQNQPLFRDVDHFLSNNSFQIIGLKRNLMRRNSNGQVSRWLLGRGQLIHCDALYVNPLFPDLFEPNQYKIAYLALCAYGKEDLAAYYFGKQTIPSSFKFKYKIHDFRKRINYALGLKSYHEAFYDFNY